MRISFLFQILFFLLLLPSCESSVATSPLSDPQTEVFAHYLKNNFDDSLSTNHHLYILISKKDTRENISKIVLKIKNKLLFKNQQTYSTIITSSLSLTDSILPHGKLLNDWDAAIDKLKLPLTGVTLIQTSNRKLIAILPLTVENAENENGFLNW